MIRRLIASACAALLTACGGGTSIEPGMATASAAPASQRIALFVGDSTFTASYHGESRTPDLVQGVIAVNAAVSGTTSCAADLAQIKSMHATFVIANYAINDSVALTSDQYTACMQQIATAAKDAGSELILVEANAIVPGGSWSAHHDQEAVRSMEAIKVQIAQQVGAYYCRQPLIDWSLAYLPDGVHPGAAAKPLIAAAIAACIERAAQ